MTIKTLSVKIISIITIGLLIQTPLFAKVYRWVDENGQVNYSDQAGNTSAQRMDIDESQTSKPIPTKSTEAKEGTKKEGSEENSTQESAKEEADKKPVKAEKPKISKKEKRRLCKEGREDYKKISSRGRMREINKKGEYTYLSEKQRQKRLSAAKKKQRKYCR